MTGRNRKPCAVPPPGPTPEEEAAAYIRGLERRKQVVAEGTDPLPPGATHVVEVGKGGAKRIKRKRFS
jgi:hypothetical protein